MEEMTMRDHMGCGGRGESANTTSMAPTAIHSQPSQEREGRGIGASRVGWIWRQLLTVCILWTKMTQTFILRGHSRHKNRHWRSRLAALRHSILDRRRSRPAHIHHSVPIFRTRARRMDPVSRRQWRMLDPSPRPVASRAAAEGSGPNVYWIREPMPNGIHMVYAIDSTGTTRAACGCDLADVPALTRALRQFLRDIDPGSRLRII